MHTWSTAENPLATSAHTSGVVVAPETAAATQIHVNARGFFAYSTGIRDFSLPLGLLHGVSSGQMNRLLTATCAVGQLRIKPVASSLITTHHPPATHR